MVPVIVILAFMSLNFSCTEKPKPFISGSLEGAALEDVQRTLRRVTKSQFINTLERAFEMKLSSELVLPEDLAKENLVAIATLEATFSLRDIELFSNASWQIAGEYLAAPSFQKHFGSNCSEVTVDSFKKAYPIFAEVLFHGIEVPFVSYGDLFTSTQATLTKEDDTLTAADISCGAIQSSIAAMLVSPFSLYYENIIPSASISRVSLAHKQVYSKIVANQMAYLLWNSPPDRQLMEAASQGSLWETSQRVAEARRMLANKPRLQQGMRALFGDWMSMRSIEAMAASVSPRSPLAKSAISEFEFLVDQSINSTDFLKSFLTSKATRLDSSLAQVYGANTSDTQLASSDRAGFLTRASFLMRGGANETSVTKRGHFILEHLLCQEVPLPDPNLDLSTGLPEDASKYEVIKARLDNNSCGACHMLLDPPALGLEAYGPNGESQTFPDLGGFGLDASVNGQAYNGGVELSNILANDQRVAECFAIHLVRIAKGRHEDSDTKKVVKDVVASYLNDDSPTLENLLVALISNNLILESMEGSQ